MAQEYVKISELDATSSFGTADQFVIVQNEETVKIDDEIIGCPIDENKFIEVFEKYL